MMMMMMVIVMMMMMFFLCVSDVVGDSVMGSLKKNS